MAKRQGRTPGRDVRGGNGKRGGARQQAGAGDHGDSVRRSNARYHDAGRRDARRGDGSGPSGGGGARRSDLGTRHSGKRRGDNRHRGEESRQRERRSYIEGRRACAEALDAQVPVRRALVAHNAGDERADGSLERLMARLAAAGIEIESVPRVRLDELSSHGAHQGVMLEVAPFDYATLDDIIAEARDRDRALVIVLDHVTDEGNLGAIIRSAEVVGASGVILAKARAAGVGVGAYKTSAGGVLHVPVAQVPNVAAAVDTLKKAGFWTAAATEHAEAIAWDAPLEGRLALVMGSESDGVSRLVRERCDFACRLPQLGRVESLNVAQATTALCYEWLRRGYEAAAHPEGHPSALGEHPVVPDVSQGGEVRGG